MNIVAIEELHARLTEQLSPALRNRVEMQVVGESGLSVKIDGESCLTSIGIWPNGCCDIDFLYVTSEKGEFKHFEFSCTEAAVAPVLREINLAVGRA